MANTLGVYVHIPWCERRCRYCDFVTSASELRPWTDYFGALTAHVQRYADCFDAADDLTLFFGGGTPSLAPPEELARFVASIRHFNKPLREVTLEANPSSTDADKLQAWRDAGISRLSFGVQALDDDALTWLGRLHSSADALRVLALAQEYFGDAISGDIIYGLPLDKPDRAIHDAEQLIKLGLKHISLYGLAIESGTPLGVAVQKGEEPDVDAESQHEMYHALVATMARAGIERYEVSNFAAPGRECQHNLVYWSGQPYLGIGIGAHGYLPGGWPQAGPFGMRSRSGRNIQAYISNLAQGDSPYEERYELAAQEALDGLLIAGLRTRQGLARSHIENLFGQTLEALCGETLTRHLEAGTLQFQGDNLRASERGIEFADTLVTQLSLAASDSLTKSG